MGGVGGDVGSGEGGGYGLYGLILKRERVIRVSRSGVENLTKIGRHIRV